MKNVVFHGDEAGLHGARFDFTFGNQVDLHYDPSTGSWSGSFPWGFYDSSFHSWAPQLDEKYEAAVIQTAKRLAKAIGAV